MINVTDFGVINCTLSFNGNAWLKWQQNNQDKADRAEKNTRLSLHIQSLGDQRQNELIIR